MSTATAPLSRQARKAETRRALIQAAAELFAHQGLDATSMDEIGAAVGLTKGAVYAHFSSKAQLVEEVLDATGTTVPGEQLLDPEHTLAEGFAQLGRDAANLLPKVERPTLMLYLEYLLYVMRDPRRRQKYLREQRRRKAENGAELDAVASARGREVLIQGRDLIALLNGLGEGLALTYAMDPEAFDAEALVRLFAAIGYGLENAEAVTALLSSRSST